MLPSHAVPNDPAGFKRKILNPIRSSSGVAVVTVLTKPYPCPGRCVYCPTDARAPKSYLFPEPPVQRALQNDYDPYGQVQERLQALANTGHATEKIELIVKGGTWSFYPEDYQRRFIQRCFDAANGTDSIDLAQAHEWNETAHNRIIGLTVETRPDYVNEAEIRRLRELGVTRVELGVQSLEDRVLELTKRGHTTREVAKATQLLRDAGFKIAYHLMPNLPGATPDDDRNTFKRLFEDPAFQPDALKIYPCVVLESAELFQWWHQARFQPYDDETLLELFVQLKQLVPPYVRIERVVRDIAAPLVQAGCRQNNLRESVLKRMKTRGIFCRCIRCREVRCEPNGNFQLVRREYEAAGGKEIFLSFEEVGCGRLAALLRLRLTSNRAAMVRELHTYGRQVPIENQDVTAAQQEGGVVSRPLAKATQQEGGVVSRPLAKAAQHRGFGKRLMAEAERIAREEFGSRRIRVIAGIGVRGYYRKLGYEEQDSYMVKRCNTSHANFRPAPASCGIGGESATRYGAAAWGDGHFA